MAVIGTGVIANAGHIPAGKNLKEEVAIVAVADILEDRAQVVAKTEGMPRAYGDWQRMLAAEQPDIVSVCTPNVYHKEQTIAALKAGDRATAPMLLAVKGGDTPWTRSAGKRSFLEGSRR